MRRLLDVVSEGGRWRYTEEQLWYLAHLVRGRRPPRLPELTPWYTQIRWSELRKGVPFPAALLGAGQLFDVVPLTLLGAFFGIALIGATTLPEYPHDNYTKEPMVRIDTFRNYVIARWVELYGELPGLIDADTSSEPGRPLLTIVTPSVSVRHCLDANGVTARLSLAFASDVEAAPTGVPVAVLHDVSARAFLDAVGGPQDLTPRPATALAARWSVWFKERPPLAGPRRRLRRAKALSPAETMLLNQGWWCPVAGIPPGPLIALITDAWTRLTDPDARTAASIGFLTWPSPSDTPSR